MYITQQLYSQYGEDLTLKLSYLKWVGQSVENKGDGRAGGGKFGKFRQTSTGMSANTPALDSFLPSLC